MKQTFKEVLKTALDLENAQLYSVNQNMMEISKAGKKKPGFVKVAIDDETAQDLMVRKVVGFIVFFDGDELNDLAIKLDN